MTKENTEELEKQLEVLKKSVIAHFGQIEVPNLGYVNNDNFEEYVTKLVALAGENP